MSEDLRHPEETCSFHYYNSCVFNMAKFPMWDKNVIQTQWEHF